MAGYRFCRSDDLPLLVEAYNACWTPHFPDEPPLTLERLKRDVRELNVWASSCMLAVEGDLVVGVLLGAKRTDANFVHRIAVRPGHERKGHGRHLLTSLTQKAKILGPPRLLAEVPSEWSGACRFFERCGFRAEASYADFALPSSAGGGGSKGAATLAAPVTLEDLLESNALDTSIPRSWERSLTTLRNRKAQIQGLAIASDVRVEAYLLHRLDEPSQEIVAIGSVPEGPARSLLRSLVSGLARSIPREIRISRAHQSEVSEATLGEMGFRLLGRHVGYAA